MIVECLISLMMNYKMPDLPYAPDALEPIISEETVNYHYGKHLQTYVNNLNALTENTDFAGRPLEYVVRHAAEGPIYNNAGQVLNHTLYFQQFSPLRPDEREAMLRCAEEMKAQAHAHTDKKAMKECPMRKPTGKLLVAIEDNFGSYENFQKLMNAASTSLFGSGWVWLAAEPNGKLHVVQEPNGGNPLRKSMTPLLGFDVWEHAYYLDFQNRRADHLASLWYIIDWDVINDRFLRAKP